MTIVELFTKTAGPADGCWEWTGARTVRGYGRVGHRGRATGAHRLAWELVNGPIPDGAWVLHRCDNPPCVRPDHLFIGDAYSNINDMFEKGRGRAGGRPCRATSPRMIYGGCGQYLAPWMYCGSRLSGRPVVFVFCSAPCSDTVPAEALR